MLRTSMVHPVITTLHATSCHLAMHMFCHAEDNNGTSCSTTTATMLPAQFWPQGECYILSSCHTHVCHAEDNNATSCHFAIHMFCRAEHNNGTSCTTTKSPFTVHTVHPVISPYACFVMLRGKKKRLHHSTILATR